MYPSPPPTPTEGPEATYAPVRPRWLVAALVLPSLITLLGLAVMARPIPIGTAPSTAATEMRVRLQRDANLDVIVLGNSMARRSIHGPQLRRLLGVRGTVAGVTLPSATPTTWYAVLKHWVYGLGHDPKLVVVAAASRAFWMERSLPGLDLRATLQIAGSHDPVIEAHRRKNGPRWDPLRRITIRRQIWRVGVRNLARSVAGGKSVAHLNTSLDVFVMGVEQTNPLAAPALLYQREGLTDDLNKTLLPELVARVHAGGGEVVFAVVPMRGVPSPDDLARDADLARWATAHGSVLVDMPNLRLTPEHYADQQHLTPAGATRYTSALGQAIRRWRGR